jgi:hypothetical protein
MQDQFFMPLGKEVLLLLIDDNEISGIFNGFVSFSGIPAVFISKDYDGLRKETLIPINQIISFEVIKPKQLIL